MRNHAVDIVLTDLAMEPMNGIEFVRSLRTGPDSPGPMLPVIIITGHASVKRLLEALDAGVNELMG
ncbi:MAG: response regulator [Phenylobacterium sp.]